MASNTENNQSCTICDKLGLKPLTRDNVYNYYIPLHSLVSYAGLSINVMNPGFVSKLVPKKDMTNVLLFSSLIGTGFYIYGRRSLQEIPKNQRYLYAALGATLFSMGSVLSWAVIKSVLPKDNSFVATIAGLVTGAAIVKLSINFFDDIDKLAKK